MQKKHPDSIHARSPMKTNPAFKLALLAAFAGAAAAGWFYQRERAPQSSPVSRGAHLATLAGCFACHGQADDDPRINFRSANEQWRPGGIDMIWDEGLLDANEVIEWITHGVPERQRERHQRLLLQMPAYGDDGHFDAEQIEDIAAWALAEGLRRSHRVSSLDPLPEATAIADLSETELLRRGDALAREHGCYQCHGELGQGAVPNPASFKGYIPGFQGNDFLHLTANGDRAEIRHWIEHGRGQAIESGLLGGLAKRYFDRQAIPMPPYAEVMADRDIETLVEFPLLLHAKGPLDVRGVDAMAKTLAEESD